MEKLIRKEKLELLTTLVELRIYCGCSIGDLIGKPISHFNFDAVKIAIQEMKDEKKTIDGHDY